MAGFESFAAYQFMLGAPQEDGVALIEHLRLVEEKTGRTPQALLDAPALPEGCEELWRVFRELSDCRAWPFGPQRITFADIDSFQRVTGIVLKPWELKAVRRADKAFLAEWSDRNKRDA